IDATTNLPNRNQLVLDIKNHNKPTLIIFEVVDFEEVGNVYGENIADKMLKQIAELYKDQIPQERSLYKFEYNQFAILLEDFDEAKVKNLISLFETLSILSSFEAYSIEIYFKLQYGIAMEKEKIVEKAYRALQHAKVTPGNRYSIYRKESSFAQNQKKNIIFGIQLREAIDGQNLKAFYQPIMDIKTQTVQKYEALARIKVNNEIIPPNDFIPVGKHMGLHTAITKNMITSSFRKFKDNKYSLSLNLSLEDFIDNDVITFIKQRVKDFDIDPSRVVIEVTEDISLDEHKHILYKLEGLKSCFFKISIDDFGTKMSNLSNICLIEPDFIKIDGKFIKDLDTNSKNRAIVRGIVSIAQNIGAKTVAEYVHNEEILHIVQELEVDYAQGYHIGIPSEFIEGD
ncbi:MAG: EAL domain-containing protein, partial [Campylobacterota bacterium]